MHFPCPIGVKSLSSAIVSTLVVALPSGDAPAFFDAVAGPSDIYLPTTRTDDTVTWLRRLGFAGRFPVDGTTPTAHTLLSAHAFVAQMMAGKDAAWWRAHREERVGQPIDPRVPLTATCILRMCLGLPSITDVALSLPKLVGHHPLDVHEDLYTHPIRCSVADGVHLFHAEQDLPGLWRHTLFGSGAMPQPMAHHKVALESGWTVGVFPFFCESALHNGTIRFLKPFLPKGAGVVAFTQYDTRIEVETVLDGQWSNPTHWSASKPVTRTRFAKELLMALHGVPVVPRDRPGFLRPIQDALDLI
jgi:hypothetical protein